MGLCGCLWFCVGCRHRRLLLVSFDQGDGHFYVTFEVNVGSYCCGGCMRKDSRDRGEKGKVKFRVIDFEVEGSDESLQESLRSIVAAIHRAPASGSRGLPGAPPRRPLSSQPLQPQGDLFPDDASSEEDAEVDEDGQESFVEAKPVRSSGAVRRSPPNPKFLDNLNFQSGTVSFKDFVGQKQPMNETKRCLVIMVWLKDNLGVEEVDANHVYTGYRTAGWSAPKDVGSTLRTLKKRSWVVGGKEKGNFKLTQPGRDIVDALPGEP